MNQKNFLTVVSVIFTLIAALHILRIIFGWSAEIGGWRVPIWLSWVAVLMAGYLAYRGWKMRKL